MEEALMPSPCRRCKVNCRRIGQLFCDACRDAILKTAETVPVSDGEPEASEEPEEESPPPFRRNIWIAAVIAIVAGGALVVSRVLPSVLVAGGW